MDEKLRKMIVEELSKSDIKSMISSGNEDFLKSKEFKEKVKEICAKTLEELYKILWTRKNFWSDAIKK